MPFLSHVKKVFSSSRKRDGAQIQQGPAQTSANGQPAQSPASNPAAPSNSALDQPPVVDNEAPAAPGIQLFKLGNLWEEAYGQIETKSPKLIDAYKQSLLQTNETSPDLQSLINDKLAEIQNARTKITVAGREIVVRDKVQRTINSILSAGGLIGGVISAEPHAALAWAGLLVLLTPISKTISQGDDAVDGFEEISSILIRYRVIETTPIDLSATSKIPGTTTSLEELANSIKTQTIKLYAAILEYQIRLAKHLSKSRLLRLAEDVAATDDWHEMFQLITHLDETIQSRWKILDGQVLRKVESEVVAIQEKIALSMNIMSEVRDEAKAIRQEQLLNSLEVARGARFDSFDDQHKPCCLEGTQVDTLQQIQAWLESTDSEAMYWLAGMAGTGKSTISRTVASACCHRTPLGNQTAFPENVFLGGVFFFDKNEGDRSTARKLFTTLCKCLTEHLPGIKSDVSDYISSHPNIGNESISSQWKNLILDPLQKFDKKNLVSFTLVLVIDALDECESEDDIGIMLQLFSQVHILSTISLRFFVTSRPEATIQSSFDSVVDVAVLRKELQKVALSIGTGNSVDDITRFLLHGIEQIAQRHSLTMGWPGKENVQKLSFKSDGLFIYAATACRFLGESRITRNQRDARLKSILEGKVNEKSPQGNLDKMYMQILETSVTGDAIDEEREQLCELFRNIVGALINLVEPLSMDHLANLLSLEFSDVSEILERLYSVLSFGENRTSPVTLVHLSFRDFLLDEHRCLESGFLIRQKEAHTILLHQCLAALSDTLKENICLLPKPSSRATDVDLQVLEKNISRHVQYASLHWVVHLRGASINPVDGSEVHEFLEIHILHWLESLSLMQKMSDGVSQVLSLAEYIEALPAEGRGELRSLISDIKRFLLSFRIMVEETPLQIYTAAIAYSPKTSSVRKLFESRMLASIGRPPVAKKHWDSWQHSLSESQSSSISFSPDGKMVASDTARVWDTKTGTLLNTFDNSSYGKFVKFSHDGKMIICLSTDGIFRTWNVYTGVKEKEIRIKKPEPSGKTLSVTSVLLSHDQSLGVVGTFSGEVYVCDLENGDAITRIHQNSGNSSGKVTLIALSNDKTMVAFSKKDGSLIIRDTRSGAICEGFHGTFQARRLRPVGNFSSSSRLFAAISHDDTVQIWECATGKLVTGIKGEWKSLSFLPNDNLFMSSHTEAKTFSIESDTFVGAVKELKPFHGIQFSSDHKVFIYWDFEKSYSKPLHIELWNYETGERIVDLKGPHSDPKTVTISDDKTQLAILCHDWTIRLWNLAQEPQSQDSCQTPKEGYEAFDGREIFEMIPHPRRDLVVSFPLDEKGEVKLWNTTTAAVEHPLGLLGSVDILPKSLSPDGQLIVSTDVVSPDNKQKHQIRDIFTGDILKEFEVTQNWHSAAVFSPDCGLLADGSIHLEDTSIESLDNLDRSATCSMSPYARVWDISSGEVLHQFESKVACGMHFYSAQLAFSPDGLFLAVIRQAKMQLEEPVALEIWAVNSWTLMKSTTLAAHVVKSIALSPGGTVLAYASPSSGGGIRLQYMTTDKVQTIVEEASNISLEFSPDGKYFCFVGDAVVAGSLEYTTIGLCDVKTASLIGVRDLNGCRDSWSRFSADGKTIDTSMGRLDVQSFYPEPSATGNRSLFYENGWIICGSEKVLRYPFGSELGVKCAAATKDTLMVAHASGYVDFLEFTATEKLIRD